MWVKRGTLFGGCFIFHLWYILIPSLSSGATRIKSDDITLDSQQRSLIVRLSSESNPVIMAEKQSRYAMDLKHLAIVVQVLGRIHDQIRIFWTGVCAEGFATMSSHPFSHQTRMGLIEVMTALISLIGFTIFASAALGVITFVILKLIMDLSLGLASMLFNLMTHFVGSRLRFVCSGMMMLFLCLKGVFPFIVDVETQRG